MELTASQARVLEAIRDYTREHGWAPTYREIGERCGYSSPATARQHVQALARKGALVRGNGARALKTIW